MAEGAEEEGTKTEGKSERVRVRIRGDVEERKRQITTNNRKETLKERDRRFGRKSRFFLQKRCVFYMKTTFLLDMRLFIAR